MVLVSHLLFTLLKEVPLTTLCVEKCHSRMLKHSSISSLFDLLKRFIFPLVLPFELIIPFLGIHPKELSSNIENTFVQIFFFFLLPFSLLLCTLAGSDCQKLLELVLATPSQILLRCYFNYENGGSRECSTFGGSNENVRQEGCNLNFCYTTFPGFYQRPSYEVCIPQVCLSG